MTEKINERLLNWASILADTTRDQAVRTSTMPFIHPHLALMPDAHLGMGATVGSVIPTLGAIMPAAVGVDIGCGMTAAQLDVTADDIEQLDRSALHAAISAAVPLSAGKYNWSVAKTAEPRVQQLTDLDGSADATAIAPHWQLQVGSLGSGNHFIEVCLDQDRAVWLFLHSGSRGVGNRLAQKHITIAQRQCSQRWIALPDPDLAYLVEGDREFWDYLRALRWAQEFARLNRAEMMQRVHGCFQEWTGRPAEVVQEIDCHHNYTEKERHFGTSMWLSRKGAIAAHRGQLGLIPGSMGAASYVVAGKGNRLALFSSPHGAGRNYSRRAARATFNRGDLDQRMSGIAWGNSGAFLDEHPDAYKDIDVVMADAADLVEVRATLHQIVNVKGD